MCASGQWTLLEPAASANSFACASKADFTLVPPSTASCSSSSSGGGSSSGVLHPRIHHAKRPAVPQPVSPCLSGWTPLPTFVDTSGGAANTVCYRLFTDPSEVGGRLGNNFESAREHCGAVHPKASLASVMSLQNAWIESALLSPMAALHDLVLVQRQQPLPRDDPTRPAAAWPHHLDTMVPLSTIVMTVEGSGTTTVTMSYMQLNLNHAGLWGHHPTRTGDSAVMEQRWSVCIAYGPPSPFLPVPQPALMITVHRQHVDRFAITPRTSFTSSEVVAAAEAADASATHLNVNTGFACMLWLHGLDVQLWSATTPHSAQVAFSVVRSSSGTVDDTAPQCSDANLFYAQRGLGLLAREDLHTHATGGNSSAGDEEAARLDGEAARVGVVVPLGFFMQHSLRQMQLCLSVPLAFEANTTSSDGEPVPQRCLFTALLVNVTLDVRPIQLLYMGRYSTIPAALPTAGAAVIRLAEGTRDVVLPLTGDGIRPEMTMFLSPQLCHGVPTGSSGSSDNLVERQSALNISGGLAL